MTDPQHIRIGTRGSALARWQAEHIASLLAERGVRTEMVHITTQGDATSGPIGSIGGQGVFTKAIQQALLGGEIDLAVHSLKDLPTERAPGLALAAVPPRESPGDVLISRGRLPLDELAPGARMGTGSLRRRAQLLHVRGDLEVLDIRGNVETRIRKLDQGQYDAICLAESGMRRLGLDDRITQVLPRDLVLPAVGQGALGLEIRDDDHTARQMLEPLSDAHAFDAATAERAMLRTLRGGCLAPVGAWARRDDGRLLLEGVVLSHDGRRRLYASAAASSDQAESLGVSVAEELLSQGAGELIAASREG